MLIVVFACTKEAPLDYPDKNTVFYASSGGYKLTGVVDRFIESSDKPTCDSYSDASTEYYVTYLKAGTYIVYVLTNHGNVERTITIHENSCNIFDCANIYDWQ